MPLANLEEALGLAPRALPRLGGLRDRARRNPYDPADEDEAALEQALQARIRDLPPEPAEASPHGALQTALDLLDLPRNAVANLINLGVGAEPTSKETFAGLRRVTSADLLRQLGLSRGNADPDAPFLDRAADAVAGFVGDVALDPLTYLTFGTGAALGSAGRKVGQHVLTEGGEKLLTQAVRRTQGQAGREAFARALAGGAERDAARQAAREAVTDTARGFGRVPTTHAAYTPDPRGALGLAFDTQRGAKAVRERLADNLAEQAPEIIDRTGIGWRVPFTKLQGTLATKDQLSSAARALRLPELGAAVKRVPGVEPVLDLLGSAGRELRKRFSSEPLPAIPGDAADAARFEAQSFQKFAERETGKQMRRTAVEESRKLNRWIADIEKETGLKRPVARAAVFALAERMNSREAGNVIAQRVGALVRELGGTEEQAGKLVRWVGAEEAPLRTAMGRAPDLSPEIDLFGNPIYEPIDGPQLTLWNEEPRPETPRTPAAEPSDTLRAMTAQVLATIPGQRVPPVATVKKYLIDRYGAATVEGALRDAKLRTPAADAQVQGAIDHATKGGWLFGAPPGSAETTARAAEVERLRAENAAILETPLMSEGSISPAQMGMLSPRQRAALVEKQQQRLRVESQIRELQRSDAEIAADTAALADRKRTDRIGQIERALDDLRRVGVGARGTIRPKYQAEITKLEAELAGLRAPDLAPARRAVGEKLTLLDGAMNEYDGELAVVDADALLASHRPVKDHGEIVRIEPHQEYPVGFQARERAADASLQQIRGIAKNPKFELLLDFGPDVTSGPPIVANIGGRDVVVQGNGRTAGMLGWTEEQWSQYRAALGERIDVPAGMKHPVLVRRLTGDVDSARRMAALGNESAMLRKSRIERAREALNLRAGDTIPPVRINDAVTRDNVGSVLADSSNRPFYNWLMQSVPDQRRAELLADPTALAEKVNDAFVAMLPRKVQDIAAGMPQEVEDMFTAAAPVAARLHTAVREGRVRPEYDLYSALEQAAVLFGQLRNTKGSYKRIVSDLNALASTETFAGMTDDLAEATQRGVALAIGLVKASRATDPTGTLLEALGNITRTALADDPRQMGFLAADPIESAARLYLDTFVGPAQTDNLLAAMQTIKQRQAPAAAALAESARAAASAAPLPEEISKATPETGGVQQVANGNPAPERVALYDDVRKWAAAAGVDETTSRGLLTVMDRFSDDSVRGLRLQHGTPEEAARVAELAGRSPAAAFYYDDLLKPEERAVLGARGIVRLFQRAPKDYDDIGLVLEEFGHHVHRNVLTQADRDVIAQWFDSKTTAQWADELRQRGVRPELADYYAKNEYELFSRHFADFVMGKEVAASPEMRTLWQKTLDVLRDLWTQLVGDGTVATDQRIAALIEKHYAAPGAPQRVAPLGRQQRLIPEPRGPLGVPGEFPQGRPGPQPPLFPGALEPEGVPGNFPMPRGAGFTPEMEFPRPPPPGPPGTLHMPDPVREVVDYIQGRAALRVTAERTAGVPSARLTTERDIGHLTRFLMDDPKSKFGGLIRQTGMKVKSWAQLRRADWWREKFADEINDVVKQVNLYQQGKTAGDAKVHQLVEGLRLRQGETLPEVLMDPVVAHVARELESVKLIGSAEFLKESARRFGTPLVKGEKIPAGLVKLQAGQFGDLLDHVAFRPEVAQLLERHVGQWKEVSAPLQAYRGLLGLWKGAALLAPAYHLRNVFGNVWNSMLLDGFSLAGMRDAIAVQRAIQRGTHLGQRIAGTHYTIEGLWKKMAVDGGVLGSGFFGTEGRVTRERVSQMLEALENPASARRALGEAGGLHPFKANHTIGQIFEEQAKIGFVITRLRKGDDLGTALTKMKKALFDYGDLTDFERGTATAAGMRDVLPFYTWTRKNSELLLALAFNQPGKLAIVPKVQGNLESALAGEDTLPASLRPAFIQKEGGIQVSGGTRPQFLNAGYIAPIGELALLNPLAPRQAAQKLMDSVAGPAKTAGELAANWDSFQDKPIREYPEQRKEFVGVDMPPELAHVARTVRPLNAVNQAIRSVESSGSTGQAIGNVAAQTLGVRTFAVDVPRQVFEAERGLNVQIGAMRRDMKRRIAELQNAGQPAAGDGELGRLLGGLQELTARRDALPLRDVRAAIKPLSDRRKKMLADYVAAGSGENSQQ